MDSRYKYGKHIKDQICVKKIPLPLMIGELLLIFVFLRYILNFTQLVSPSEGSLAVVLINLTSIVLTLLLAVSSVYAVLGVPSTKPSAWRGVVWSALILFATNFAYGILEEYNLMGSPVVFRNEVMAIIMIIVIAIMFLPSVRKFYTPPMMDVPPLRDWLLYIFLKPIIRSDKYRLVYGNADTNDET